MYLYNNTTGTYNYWVQNSNGYIGLNKSSANSQLDVNGNAQIRGNLTVTGTSVIINTSLVPATSSADGLPGQIAWGPGYVYVCTALNTWKRAALSSW